MHKRVAPFRERGVAESKSLIDDELPHILGNFTRIPPPTPSSRNCDI